MNDAVHHARRHRSLTALILFTCTLFISVAPSSVSSQAANPPSGLQYLAEARKQLLDAQDAKPSDPATVLHAMLILAQRQTVARQITKETVDLSKDAITLSEKSFGHESREYAWALAGMAKVHMAMNHPELGRPLAEQAVEIAQRVAPLSGNLAESADALDKICFALNDLPCALHAGEIAIESIRAAHNQDELYLASMLQDLAHVRITTGDRDGARKDMEESLAIVARQPTPKPSMAILESNAGMYFNWVGKMDESRAHLAKSLALSDSIYGPESVQVAHASEILAELDSRGGHFLQAVPLFESSLGIYRTSYGPAHASTAELEASYARALAAAGRLQPAIDMSLLAHQALREYFSLAVRVMPERQALALAPNSSSAFSPALSVIASHPDLDATAIYQEQIRSRALIAEEMALRQASLNRKDDPVVADLLKQLDHERSAQLDQLGATKDKLPANIANDAQLRMERIERALAERSAAFRAGQRTRTVALDDLRRQLPRQSVLISYVQYTRIAVDAPLTYGGTTAYLAFILHPDSAHIQVFDLGDAKSIDALVSEARATSDAESHSGGLNSIRNERAYRTAGEALRKRIWDPLLTAIGTAKLALVVPDGRLNLIPFSALPEGNGYLVEHGPVIHTLSSERDLVPDGSSPQRAGLLAVGNPRFASLPEQSNTAALRGGPAQCDAFNKLTFHDLPGSASEVADLTALWRRWNVNERNDLLVGADATRTHFLSAAAGHRILHLATHAYLLDNHCGNGNPLLNSGLVFAGANQDRDASILTAQQIASLDLSGVNWAVLSACNTGNGELFDGEGVLGLQRAFRVAGAQSIVMALWPVDDDVTRRFMHELYAQRLGKHATTANSVWNADRTLLLQRRAKGESTHPWYWAGFVGSGDWN